jgi:phage anti-repressor protein
MTINQSKAFEERYLCEAQDLLEKLEISNFSTLWLTKIVILAGYLEKIEIMESALNGLNKNKRDEDRRGEMEQIIDSCCIKINQYFVSSITGQGFFSEKILRCPGYVHVIAHDSRIICKNELILKSLEKMSLKWKNPLKAQDIKTRLNQFAESCLEKAGTPFFDWMS